MVDTGIHYHVSLVQGEIVADSWVENHEIVSVKSVSEVSEVSENLVTHMPSLMCF